VHQTLEFLARHGYSLMFAMVPSEQLGIPIPAMPVLLAMGALVGLEHYSFALALGLAMIAAVGADSTWYILGRNKGHSILKLLCRISLEPDSCVSTTRYWFKKLGAWALVICKFVPGLSAVSTPMAGLARMPWWKFLLADATGSLLWSGTFLTLGYLFRLQLELVGQVALRLGSWAGAIVGGAVALWIGWKYWQRKKFMRSLRIARITPEELMEHLADVVVLDLRTPAEVEWDGMKLQGALWFDRKELEQRHMEIPRDRDVVLYCT
jgi:membrane protein DedA with SNARE-associated domain